MKRNLLALSLGILSVMSCSKDDENENAASIVGVWKESKTIIYNGKDNSILNTELPDNCDKKNFYEFTKEGKFNSKIHYTKNDGTCMEDSTTLMNYAYNYETKKLSLDDEVSDVLLLTNNELHVVVDMEDENNDDVNDKIVLVLVK